MVARQPTDAYCSHEAMPKVDQALARPAYQALRARVGGSLITFNEDGSETNWGDVESGDFIPGPHYGQKTGTGAEVIGWKNDE